MYKSKGLLRSGILKINSNHSGEILSPIVDYKIGKAPMILLKCN